MSGSEILVKDGYEKVAVTYDFGICFKYMLSTSLYLLTDVDFFTSRVAIENLSIINQEGKIHYDSFNQRVNSNNLTIGIGFFVDK